MKSRGSEKIHTGKPGGKPSMSVPGDGEVTKQEGGLDGRSAAHYADPTSRVGGAGGQSHEYKGRG